VDVKKVQRDGVGGAVLRRWKRNCDHPLPSVLTASWRREPHIASAGPAIAAAQLRVDFAEAYVPLIPLCSGGSALGIQAATERHFRSRYRQIQGSTPLGTRLAEAGPETLRQHLIFCMDSPSAGFPVASKSRGQFESSKLKTTCLGFSDLDVSHVGEAPPSALMPTNK
jgi:hypothetical protein